KDPPLPGRRGPVTEGRGPIISSGGCLDPPTRPNAQGRDMLGARVAIVLKDGSTRWRRARADGSYASANDPRVLMGLGNITHTPQVRVQWPDGRSEQWAQVPIDRWTTLQKGSGEPSAVATNAAEEQRRAGVGPREP
ncbi:MAG TPA: ASPIC/UnbV domain-containing protein, partial [Vicinamibacterales bacterium]